MLRVIPLLVFVVLIVPYPESAASPSLPGMFPAEISGWTPRGSDGIYSAETLYDLIDGGAEVYRSLNVRNVVSRRYGREGWPDIIVDLFDMASPSDAFGAYHYDIRDGEKAGIGRESESSGASLFFWQDRYFVSLIPFGEDEEMKEAVLALGRAIAKAIPDRGVRPELISLLPARGLIESQIHYFHDWSLLNNFYFLAEENILLLDDRTEGLLARYRRIGGKKTGSDHRPWTLVVISYPKKDLAEKARRNFIDRFLPKGGDDGYGRLEDGSWAGLEITENVLIGLFDAPGKEEAVKIIEEVKENRWQKGKKD